MNCRCTYCMASNMCSITSFLFKLLNLPFPFDPNRPLLDISYDFHIQLPRGTSYLRLYLIQSPKPSHFNHFSFLSGNIHILYWSSTKNIAS